MTGVAELNIESQRIGPERGTVAPLHAADWRFLLPRDSSRPFKQVVLLGARPGLRELLLDLGLAEAVTTVLPRDGSAEAVVILNGASADLTDIAASMCPDGVLYHEFNRYDWRKPGRSPAQMRRALREQGLSPVVTHAIAPHPSKAMVYLPLEARHALDWYVRTIYDTPTLLRRLVDVGYRLVRRIAPELLGRFFPWFAITARRCQSKDSTPSALRAGANTAGIDPDDLVPLMLADTGNRVVVLPFAKSGHAPVVVLKIPKVASVNDRTENEQRVLADIRSRVSDEMREGIPRPIGIVPFAGVSIAVEPYLAGESLKRLSADWSRSVESKVGDLAAAAAWLGTFNRQTEVNRAEWDGEEIERWVRAPQTLYCQHFGETEHERTLFAAARAWADDLRGVPFPLVWHHRDFNIWNVFRDDNRINVLDWEGARPGPPLCDLLHFTTHWYEAAVRAFREPPRMRAFQALWIPTGAHGSDYVNGAHRVIRTYLSQMQIEERFVPLLLVYTWLELALRRADQQRDQGMKPVRAREGNRNFAYIDVLARHSDLLFPRSRVL
jgi:hypothetical protein